MITFKDSNLLQADTEALVNTVNTVGVMGKGIALQFKEKFEMNYKLYKKACKSGEVNPGKMFVTKTNRAIGPKYIINFPTKTDWRSYTKLDYIETGLDDLIRVIKENNIQSIAIPPLGCGNGGLDWSVVKPIISRKLSEISKEIEIEVYEPGNYSYVRTTNASAPALTKARALILSLADRYNILGFDISHLELQKLAYFSQIFGQEELNLKFEKGHYVPYATNLKHLLSHLEGYYFKGQIRFQDSKPTDALKLDSSRIPEVAAFIDKELDSIEKLRLQKVEGFITGFESPFGLELLATTHWAANELKEKATLKNVVTYIHAWSERKKQNMTESQIEIALERVNKFNSVSI